MHDEQTKGERTRAVILDQAAGLATEVGLEGLSIGQLADATGMSKSGLYAHFGSKRELQLATIEAARQTFVEEVMRPALRSPRGIERLLAICATYLAHVERRVFPGGCFFSAAAVDVGTRPGPVHDAIVAQQLGWLSLLERLTREAMQCGDLDPGHRPGAARLRTSGASRRGEHGVYPPRRRRSVRASPRGSPHTTPRTLGGEQLALRRQQADPVRHPRTTLGSHLDRYRRPAIGPGRPVSDTRQITPGRANSHQTLPALWLPVRGLGTLERCS